MRFLKRLQAGTMLTGALLFKSYVATRLLDTKRELRDLRGRRDMLRDLSAKADMAIAATMNEYMRAGRSRRRVHVDDDGIHMGEDLH